MLDDAAGLDDLGKGAGGLGGDAEELWKSSEAGT